MASEASTKEAKAVPDWGRALLCGGTDWPVLGRKIKGGGKPVNEERPDLASPHIIRAVANVRMKRVFANHSSCSNVLLDVHGGVYVFGRNEHGQLGLGHSSTVWQPEKLDPSKHFQPPLRPGEKVVECGVGRNHLLLVTSEGNAYAAGDNKMGQCGNHDLRDQTTFKRIDYAPYIKQTDKVISAGAGLTFSLLLTEAGRVYAFGSSEKGQLGNGRTGEHFISGSKLAFETRSTPMLVRALTDKKITQISVGQQHSIALDEGGYVYVWGFGGYGRLGLGNQADQLTPTLVPQFAGSNEMTRAAQVVAGPTNSVVIDRQGLYQLAGKWKTTGDGSAGQGFMTFRYLPDIMDCKVRLASLGGVTLFAVADDEPTDYGATLNISWGQNAVNGELGHGEDKKRSATKPVLCEPLRGIALLDVSAGQNTTLFVARSLGPTYSELPRHPAVIESSEVCMVCGRGQETEGNALLECEKCENPYHLHCLDPPLEAVPEGEWFCPGKGCRTDDVEHAGVAATIKTVERKNGATVKGEEDEGGDKAATEEEEEEEEGESDEAVPAPRKRGRSGASGKAASPAAQRKRTRKA